MKNSHPNNNLRLGDEWKAATGGCAFFGDKYFRRYGDALDLLAKKLNNFICDIDDMGMWQRSSGNNGARAFALLALSSDIVEACERWRSNANRRGDASKNIGSHLSAKERKRYANAAATLAELFEASPHEIGPIIAAGHHLIRTGPDAMVALDADVAERFQRQFLEMQRRSISPRAIVSFLRLTEKALGRDRRTSRRHRPADETGLWIEIATLLRVATGASWHYQYEADPREPVGGRPNYEVVAAFSIAAGADGSADQPITATLIKNRLTKRRAEL